MVSIRKLVVGMSLALAAVSAVSPASAQMVPEIPRYDLPDVAMVSLDASGSPVILYNPSACQAAGPACEFFRAHEYGHVMLGHLYDPAARLPAGQARAEAQADCFAARNSSSLAVRAMIQLVLQQPPDPRDAIYGTKPARASRIAACGGIQ